MTHFIDRSTVSDAHAAPTTNHSRRAATCLAAALGLLVCATAAHGERMLLTLDTQDRLAWRETRREIERLGGRVLAVHPPQVLIVDLDPSILPHLKTRGLVASSTTGLSALPAQASLSARSGVRFWNDELKSKASPTRVDAHEHEHIACDVYLPPDVHPAILEQYDGLIGFRTADDEAEARAQLASPRAITGVGSTDFATSEFMVGDIVIGAIFPESNGVIDPDVEDWTASQISTIHGRIMTAMTRFQDDTPIAGITLVYHFDDAPDNGGVAGTIDCDYEAINSGGQARNDALGRLTYPGSPASRSYADHLRDMYNADWGFFFSMVDNNVTGGGRAFAFLGGPYTECYAHNSANVLQHETGHIFRAIDEYHPDASRSPTGRWGYQSVVNGNSEYDDGTGFNGGAGEGLSALMNNNQNKHSAYSAGQIGWYDSDGDGLLDVIDSFPGATPQLDSVTAGVATFSGQVSVSPVRSQLQGFNTGYSTNEIVDARWRLQGQAWQAISATDGAFDEGVEDITFSTPALPDGDYVVEVQGSNDKGNTTLLPATVSFNVTGSATADAVPFAAFDVDSTIQREGFNITVDATNSSDLESLPGTLQYRWDWESDSTWDTAFSSTATAQHSYTPAGGYVITLEVMDSAGQTSTTTRDVIISATNVAPVPDMQVTTGNVHGTFAAAYTFDVSGSVDPEGTPLEVRWDWTGNGGYDTSYSTNLVGQNVYTLSGSGGGKSAQWTVVAQLRDGDGATTTISREIWSCPYNDEPVLSGTVTPATAATDTLVIFDMTTTTDANSGTTWDGILEYRYDWDGDGNWDTDMLPNPFELHTFTEPGTYNTKVEVRDRFYGIDEMTFPITVGTDPVPQPFVVTGGLVQPSYAQIAPNSQHQLTLDFTYVGTPGDLSATWTVDNIPGGDAVVGTITPGGLYMAPSTVAFHTIRAISNSNPTVILTASVFVNTDFVEISPDPIDMNVGSTLQLTANTGFQTDPTVTWYVNDVEGGHPLIGTIDPSGLMTAPTSVFNDTRVYVRATSNENPLISDYVLATIHPLNPPTADFSASVVQGNAPLSVDFSAITTGGVTDWQWDFDDNGATATGPTPTHVFNDPGLYTVRLDVIGPEGSAQETKITYIQVDGGTAPLIDFTTPVNPFACFQTFCSPVTFTPTAVGQVDTWEWDFGGLDTDTQMNGEWVVPVLGTHTITLTATGPGGTTVKTKPNYLELYDVLLLPVDFLVEGPTEGTVPFAVKFVPMPDGVVCSHLWLFGDTNQSIEASPTHQYNVPGLYSVTYEVEFPFQSSPGGGTQDFCDPSGQFNSANSITKTDLILALPRGDIDGDLDVDIDDATALANVLVDTPLDPAHVARCDLDQNGTQDGIDLAIWMLIIADQ